MTKNEAISSFTDEFLSGLPPEQLARAVTRLHAMASTGLTERGINYLITLHNMNIAGVHSGFCDPIAQKDIKEILNNLKENLS